MDLTNQSGKIIVAVAPVGRKVDPPSINPLAPEAVAREVIACAEAGASMVHLHVRDREGKQTADLSSFSHTLDIIRKSSDIIIQGSTGGLSTLTLEERCVALNDPWVEVASLNMGSVNFGDDVYINTLPDIRYWADRMKKASVIPELEIFETGMLPAISQLINEKTLSWPFHFNFCLGFKWAMPADPGALLFLINQMPDPVPWGVIHDKMTDFSLLSTAIGLGASVVRVGFEDSVFFAPGKVARNNVELVEHLVSLIRIIGFEIATPDDARSILGFRKKIGD